MDRLMVMLLESHGCSAELQLNGMPIAALPPLGGRTCLAVHEYTLAGRNQIALTVSPMPAGQPATPQPRVAIGATWARARLMLLRTGQSIADPNARTLASVDWATEEGQSYDAPTQKSAEVELPDRKSVV